MIKTLISLTVVLALLAGCDASAEADPAAPAAASASASPSTQPTTQPTAQEGTAMADKIVKSDEEWRKQLTPEQYHVLREKGTERAFTGKLLKNKEHGVYTCAACGNELFSSETKFESGTGWPSFWKPIDPAKVGEIEDRAHGMVRTEVVCARCDGHLGHVFPDGPPPTGLRYCLNSAALGFVEK